MILLVTLPTFFILLAHLFDRKKVFNCWWSNPFSLLSLFDRKIGFFYRGRFGVVTMLWPLMGSLDHSYIQQPSLSFLSFATFLIYNWFSFPFPQTYAFKQPVSKLIFPSFEAKNLFEKCFTQIRRLRSSALRRSDIVQRRRRSFLPFLFKTF